MCGIVAVAGPGPDPLAQVELALQTLQRRGPDGPGFWRGPNCLLAHCRLAITAPQDRPQPVFNEDETVAAVVNGEFYGYRESRLRLERQGHRFATQGDSELVCHLYEEYGLDFYQHLRGEFALVLFDSRLRRLVALRDPYGIKPLCYSGWDGRLWLASKARALWAAGCSRGWDQEALFQVCSTQYLLPQQSYFQQIAQVPPQLMLLYQADQLRWLKLSPPARAATSEEPLSDFCQLLTQALEERLDCGQPCAFQLSGGLDSGALVALASQSRTVDAFSLCFPHTAWDESLGAEQLAAHCRARWHRVELQPEQLLHSLELAALESEGLAINAHLSAKMLLAQRVAEAGFQVVITGEGADEVLLGYPHFRLDLGVEPQRIAKSNQASAGILWSAEDFPGELTTQGLARVLGQVPHFLQAKANWGRRLHSLLRQDFLVQFRGVDPFLRMLGDCQSSGTVLENSSRLWNQSALANYILLTLGDGCEMAHSLEGRLPFLDQRLSAFLRDLPLEWKIRHGREKYILREAVRPLIPAELYRREKHPLLAPHLGGPLRQRLRPASFVDPQKLRQRLQRLEGASESEQSQWEPVLIWLYTAQALEQGYSLCSGT